MQVIILLSDWLLIIVPVMPVNWEPSPRYDDAVIIPALPKWILLPTLTKSSISADAAVRPRECKSVVPVLKLLADETPVMFTWLLKCKLPAWSNLNAWFVLFVCSVNWLSTPAGVVILVIPDMLFILICDIILFIRQQHNYHQ